MFLRHYGSSYVACVTVTCMLVFRPQSHPPSHNLASGTNLQAHTDPPQGYLTVPSTAACPQLDLAGVGVRNAGAR